MPELTAFAHLRNDFAHPARDVTVPDRLGGVLERGDEGRAAAEQRREAPRELGDREAQEEASQERQLQEHAVGPRASDRRSNPPHQEIASGDQRREEPDHVVPQEPRDPHHDHRQQRQVRVKVGEELLELRDDDRHQDGDQTAGHHEQDRRVDERRDHLSRNRDDGLLVLQVPPQDVLDLSRLLAGLERSPIEAGKDVPLLGERFGDRRSGVHPVLHVGEDGAQRGALLALEQDLEGAHDGQPRLEQRDHFLVEHQKIRHLDAAPAPSARAGKPEAVPAHLEDVSPAALDLDARRLRIGREHRLFRDGAVRPARFDRKLGAHGFFSTVFCPSVPRSAPARGVSCTRRTRIKAFFEPSSLDAPMTSV